MYLVEVKIKHMTGKVAILSMVISKIYGYQKCSIIVKSGDWSIMLAAAQAKVNNG
uniref:hypothetical protein n=1 Tax=Desulforadius tongensis TaxID=1216062 RepID=UPI001959E2C4|nr:hypothetical protein [Desulforadius tongensis]